jgi:high-affinity nickel-transport protein
MNLAAILALGFFLGMRHATDADHVVAVSTIVSRERTLRAAVPIGVLWGIGHTLTIMLVGGAIILFGIVISPSLGLGMEMCVALMLVVLGAVNVGAAVRDATVTSRSRGPADPHPAEHAPRASLGRSLRPLGVGIVHGLAGSAAVALLALGSIRDPLLGVAYLAVFGIGTIAGMLIITIAVAMPVVVVAGRFGQLRRTLGMVTGLASVSFGVFLVHKIGFVHGLFTGHSEWVPQ